MNVAIDGLNLVKEVRSVTPAKGVLWFVVILLLMVRVSFFLL